MAKKLLFLLINQLFIKVFLCVLCVSVVKLVFVP